MAELLKFRIDYEKCKPGHNIAICVLCHWTGCGDCEQLLDHRHEAHPQNTMFFNLVTGGFFYTYHQQLFDFLTLYSNDKLGNAWDASQDPK